MLRRKNRSKSRTDRQRSKQRRKSNKPQGRRPLFGRSASFERLEDRRMLATFTVDSILDSVDANPGDGIADDGLGNTTLRAAMMEANALVGTDTIAFNIPGAGPHTIQPLSALPSITDPVIIDGYTQPGASPNTNGPGLGLNTVLMIELDGSKLGPFAINGLNINAGSSTVRGLAINRFPRHGILAGRK